jgi:hypothetical protein
MERLGESPARNHDTEDVFEIIWRVVGGENASRTKNGPPD